MSHFEFHILTSIVLTNSRLPSPWVMKAVLTHPRGTCTRRNCSRQNRHHRDGDIEGPGCTLLQSASHLQLKIGAFGKTKLQKLLDPTSLYVSIFSKVQQWKFANFENANFRARIYIILSTTIQGLQVLHYRP